MLDRMFFGALAGATLGLGLHLVFSPLLGNHCVILCRTERAAVAGALLGAVVAYLTVRAARRRAKPEQKEG
jgi:disulfide bond formation protein DsbB